MAAKTPEERAAWIAEAKAKFAALPPEEQEKRARALIEAIKPDLMIVDEDGDALAVDDVSDEHGRAIYIDVCAAGTDDGMAVRFDEERARKLRDHLTAWLDAPRDAARAAAEVVATGDGFRLLRTSLGEWGVDDESGADTGEWFAAADAETLARVMYAVARGKIRCPACGAESEAAEAMGPDGIEACAACGVMS